MENGIRFPAMLTNEVHIWLTNPAEIRDPALLREYAVLMDETERRKCERYRMEKNRHECLLTRALVRTTLSRYCDRIAPAAWRFVEVGNGRPEIAPGLAPLPLRFNVSRTEGLIACAVTCDRAVGVDLERIDLRRPTSLIAERFFAAAELRDLESGPAERFYHYWTLKEAYVKARGVGLAIPLNEVAFDLGGARIEVAFGPRVADDAARWQFALEQPTAQHQLALAVERTHGVDVQVRIHSVVPLRS